MAMTLTSSNRTITLPKYAPGGFQEIIGQNIARNESLGGKLSFDILSVRGGYRISFDTITEAEWGEIREIWNDQIANREFLVLNDPSIGKTNWTVWLTIPTERDSRWNKQAVQGLTIIIEPRDANS